MSLFQPLPMDRVYLLNPGQSISVGDRLLTAVKPPSYDAPETTGFYDPKAGVLFSADCFGALMSEPQQYAGDITEKDLQQGMVRWATVDAPWLHDLDSGSFGRTLERIRQLGAKMILSGHLPVARDMTERLLGLLATAPAAEPFVGPDQQSLEAMLKGLRGK